MKTSPISTLYKSLLHTRAHQVFSVVTRHFLVTAFTMEIFQLPLSRTLWTAAPSKLHILVPHKSYLYRLIEYTSDSESKLHYDWRLTANLFVLGLSPLTLMTSDFFFQRNPCLYSPYVTSCLTRGRIYRLQILLALASAHFRVQLPWDSWPHFTVLDSRLPFSSAPTTRRVTVEVFDLASTLKNFSQEIRCPQKMQIWVPQEYKSPALELLQHTL
jgi:hypothetical protein